MLSRTPKRQHGALLLAILRDVGDPGRDGVVRRGDDDGLAVEPDGAARRPAQAEQACIASERPAPTRP